MVEHHGSDGGIHEPLELASGKHCNPNEEEKDCKSQETRTSTVEDTCGVELASRESIYAS